MDLRTSIEKVVELEQQCNVNAVLYKDMKIWPLIRLMVCTQLCHPEREILNAPGDGGSSPVFLSSDSTNILKRFRRILYLGKKSIKYIPNLYHHRRELNKLNHSSPVDLLFYSRYIEHVNVFGKYYDEHLDSMIEIINHDYHCLKVELTSEYSEATLPRYIDTTFIDPSYFFKIQTHRLTSNHSENIINFKEIKEAVEENTHGKITIDERYFINLAQVVEEHQLFYFELLSHLSPKVVFVVCYFNPNTMSLIRAAHHLGIKSVDIQHGCQGKHHALYSQWTKIPRDGYDLLPDFFWVWGDKSKENILKGQPEGSRHHQPVIGGNLWLAKCQQETWYKASQEVQEFFDSLKEYKKVILFTLQPLVEPIPPHVLRAMSRSPKNWLWLLRAHPVSRGDLPKIEQLLHQNNIDNFEAKMSSEILLPLLLEHVDHHITCGSSCGYEAIKYNVPNTIVHPNCAEDHDEYIAKGLFTCCLNEDDLLSTIENSNKHQKIVEKIPYIETDHEKAKRVLNFIILS
jgi:hypothetical protein